MPIAHHCKLRSLLQSAGLLLDVLAQCQVIDHRFFHSHSMYSPTNVDVSERIEKANDVKFVICGDLVAKRNAIGSQWIEMADGWLALMKRVNWWTGES